MRMIRKRKKVGSFKIQIHDLRQYKLEVMTLANPTHILKAPLLGSLLGIIFPFGPGCPPIGTIPRSSTSKTLSVRLKSGYYSYCHWFSIVFARVVFRNLGVCSRPKPP